MRILMITPYSIAAKRPLEWCLLNGDEILCLSDKDFYKDKPPENYRFVPTVGSTIYENINYDDVKDTKRDELCQLQIEQLQKLVKEFQPDIIHGHSFFFPVHCCALASLHPLVVSAWGFLNDLMLPEEDHPVNLLPEIPQIIDTCDALIVETPNLVDKCQPLLKSNQKLALIPLGANTQHFCPYDGENVDQAREFLQIPKEAKVLLSPRGWAKTYRHPEIIEAFSLAYSELPEPTILLFLGLGHGTPEEVKLYHQSICDLVDKMDIKDQIKMLPAMSYEMMPYIYALTDVVINYPESDAFPSTLIEAVACSKPVITVRLPAYENTFIEKFCHLVDDNNITELGKAMVEVVNTPKAQISDQLAAARQVMVEQYDEMIFRKQLLELYQNLLIFQ